MCELLFFLFPDCFPCQHGVSNSHIRCTVIGQCGSISFLPYPPALIMSSAKLTTTTTWHIRTSPIYVIKLILQRVTFTGVDSFCSSSQIVVSENPADLNTILSTCLIKNVEHVTRSSQIDISMIASAEAFPWVVEIEYSQSNTTDGKLLYFNGRGMFEVGKGPFFDLNYGFKKE